MCLPVDGRLPMLADNTARTLINIVIYVLLIAFILPWFLLLLPVAGGAFILVYIVFRVGIRRLQRFQLESMAPLLTHVDASVHGLASVHAYERVDDFQSRSVGFMSLEVMGSACVGYISTRHSTVMRIHRSQFTSY